MDIKIILKNNELAIELSDHKKTIDSINLETSNNLSKILLTSIDLILKRNKLKKNQISKFFVESNIPDLYTSNRIAKSMKKSFNFALNLK